MLTVEVAVMIVRGPITRVLRPRSLFGTAALPGWRVSSTDLGGACLTPRGADLLGYQLLCGREERAIRALLRRALRAVDPPLSPEQALIVTVMHELSLGMASRWGPYLRLLPAARGVETPLQSELLYVAHCGG